MFDTKLIKIWKCTYNNMTGFAKNVSLSNCTYSILFCQLVAQREIIWIQFFWVDHTTTSYDNISYNHLMK